MVQRNGIVSINVDELAFEKLDEGANDIIIPLKNGGGFVNCDNVEHNGMICLALTKGDKCNFFTVDEISTLKIYKRLGRDT